MTKRKGLSLTEQLQQRCVDLILDFRDPIASDGKNANGNDGDGDDTWMHADLMAEYVRSMDPGARRLKFNQVLNVVEAAIAAIKQSDQSQASAVEANGAADSEEDYASDSVLVEEPVIAAPNSMNRAILQTYAAHVPAVPKEDPTEAPEVKPATSAESVPSQETAAPAKKKKAKKKTAMTAEDYAPPNVRYADLGGITKCIDEVRELIEAPMAHPEIFQHLNITPTRGVLLHGPPGCGKTQLARAVAGELGVPFIQISAPSVVSGMSGESEKKIREVFAEAAELAPCLLFIDEIDAITPKRENAQREMERRIVAQLLTCMDDLSMEKTNNKPVIVIGATNRPDALDAALRRAGRFDREISMGIPDEKAREEILRVLTAKLRLAGDLDFHQLAKITPGYVGADLNALTATAGMFAVKRIFGQLAMTYEKEPGVEANEVDTNAMDVDDCKVNPSDIALFLQNHPQPLTEKELEPLAITMDDFRLALKKVQPSSKREGFATVPDVAWEDIGALARVRDELRMTIVEPVKYPKLFAKVGIENPSGVLLWGPPGCGKTLLAKAVANESHCNFISVKGPELLNKYVGESERGVRQVFARARASAPCVIFFDELDALCPRRGGGSDSQTSERVVNQLLTELDGLECRNSVYIIAATNRPDIIDRAILRPGRFDKLLYVQLPSAEERFEILSAISRKLPVAPGLDLHAIAHHQKCERFSGADLSSLVREAGVACLRENIARTGGDQSVMEIQTALTITMTHFEMALQRISPSVSAKDLLSYDALFRSLNGNQQSSLQ